MLEFLPEREVDVHLLVLGAIEGPGGRLRRSTARVRYIPVEHQFRLAVLPAMIGKYLRPRVLRVIEHKADQVHIALFGRRIGHRTVRPVPVASLPVRRCPQRSCAR